MMINFVTTSTGNNTIIKFGGYDEDAMELETKTDFYAKEFRTVPGTWTIQHPYSNGGIYWVAPGSVTEQLGNIDRFF